MELITIQDPSTIIDRFERVRKDYGDISALAESLKKGQIHPILVTKKDGNIELVAGGRRRKACILAKIPILAVVKESMTDLEVREWELEENIQRKDLEWQEKMDGIAELDEIKKKIYGERGPGRSGTGWSQSDTAKAVGMTQAAVSDATVLSKAMKAFPQIAEAKTAHEARKLLKKIEERLLLDELARRRKADSSVSATAHESSFIVGDTFSILPTLESASFDFANVDTPYAIGLTENKKILSDHKELRTDTEYEEWSPEEYVEKCTIVAREMFRTLKDNSWMTWWFGIQWYSEVKALLEKAGFIVDKIPAIWSQGEGKLQTLQPEKYLARGYDIFFVCRKGNPIILQRGRSNVFSFEKTDSRYKTHPTEKSFELMKEIFKTFVIPGSHCISPFLGSGVDLRAWFSIECYGVGFDNNERTKELYILNVQSDIEAKLYK